MPLQGAQGRGAFAGGRESRIPRQDRYLGRASPGTGCVAVPGGGAPRPIDRAATERTYEGPCDPLEGAAV